MCVCLCVSEKQTSRHTTEAGIRAYLCMHGQLRSPNVSALLGGPGSQGRVLFLPLRRLWTGSSGQQHICMTSADQPLGSRPQETSSWRVCRRSCGKVFVLLAARGMRPGNPRFLRIPANSLTQAWRVCVCAWVCLAAFQVGLQTFKRKAKELWGSR